MDKKRWIYLTAGALILVLLYFRASSSTEQIMIGALLILYVSLFFGIKLAQGSGGLLADKISSLFIAPKIYLREKPEMLSPIEGLILQRQFDEAEQRLQEILREKPRLADAVTMLGQLYLDHRHDYAAAETLTGEYLQREYRAQPGDLDIVNLHVDACLAQNKRQEALTCLDREARRGGYLPGQIKTMQTRRRALTE